jgi:hypothetical protein
VFVGTSREMPNMISATIPVGNSSGVSVKCQPWDGDRIRAAESILNRAYGTPPQSMELAVANWEPLEIRIKFVD